VGPAEWQSYAQFLEDVTAELRKVRELHLPAYVNFKRHREIIQAAYLKVNTARPQARLYSLWDRINIRQALAAYSPYKRDLDPTSLQDTLHRTPYTDYWKRYQLDTPVSETLFNSADRVKLIDSMIMSQLNLRRLEGRKLVKTYFPLHRIWEIERSLNMPPQLLDHTEGADERINLKSQWKQNTISQPINLIRTYFGEKIGFYFLYLESYSLWICGLAVIGLLFLLMEITNLGRVANFEAEEIYCFLTITWSSLFLEMWKRRQAKYGIQWGQTFAAEAEIVRPEFKGKLRRSPVDDNMFELYDHSGKQVLFKLLGFVISLLFAGLTIAAIAGILYERYRVRDSGGIIVAGYDLSGTLFGFLSAIQIEVFNRLFEYIAHRTTVWENHRTQGDFENSYVIKSFMYQMVNNYASIIYVAFFQSSLEGCYILQADGSKKSYSCMYDLRVQLSTIYLTHSVWNVMTLLQAEVNSARKKRENRQLEEQWRQSWQHDIHNPVTLRMQIEYELDRESYQLKNLDRTFVDYQELMIQYGYVTLFAVAFPLAPLLAFLNNVFELRVARYRLLKLTRRPIPASARGIGSWLHVLDTMTTVSVLTNSALLCFTLNAFDDELAGVTVDPIELFGFMLISVYVLRKGLAWLIPDVPTRYELATKRHAVLVERHIKKYRPARKVLSIDSEWVDMSIVGSLNYLEA